MGIKRPLEVFVIKSGHSLWNKTIRFARSSSWSAGPYLAKQMEENNFLQWERVIVAVENGKIVGYCTFTKKDELADDYNFSPFIGFVFVDEAYRGNRISEKMIASASDYAKSSGYKTIYLMSSEKGLYEKYGFKKIGDYNTIHGTIDQLFCKDI